VVCAAAPHHHCFNISLQQRHHYIIMLVTMLCHESSKYLEKYFQVLRILLSSTWKSADTPLLMRTVCSNTKAVDSELTVKNSLSTTYRTENQDKTTKS
jgi:hypothetical protein